MGADNYNKFEQTKSYARMLDVMVALRPYMELRKNLGGHRSKLGNALQAAWEKYNSNE